MSNVVARTQTAWWRSRRRVLIEWRWSGLLSGLAHRRLLGVGYKHKTDVISIELSKRLADDTGVVLGEPVSEQPVRHANGQLLAGLADKGGRFEPGVEGVAVDLGFDPGQDLSPDVASLCYCHTEDLRSMFAIAGWTPLPQRCQVWTLDPGPGCHFGSQKRPVVTNRPGLGRKP